MAVTKKRFPKKKYKKKILQNSSGWFISAQIFSTIIAKNINVGQC